MVLEVYCAHCGQAFAKTALANLSSSCYKLNVKNVQITLSDDLARDAAEAGLLEAEAFATLLRKRLKQIAETTDAALVRNEALATQSTLTPTWINPDDDAYNAL